MEQPANARLSLRNSPMVSVIMPVHNGGDLLRRAIDSVLAQTEQSFEIILIDDGSKDTTWSIIQAYAASDPRILGIHNDRSRGGAAASNIAIKKAQGSWIAVLDHDDWYHPERLQVLVEVGEQEKADLVADNQFFFDAQASSIFRTAIPESSRREKLTLQAFLKNAKTGVPKFDYGMLKPVFRASFLQNTGVRYLEECFHGYDFHVLLDFFVAGGTACLIHQAYYYYTVPFGPLSRRPAFKEKKVYDYAQMKNLTDQAIEQYRCSLCPINLRLLKHRSQAIQIYSKYLKTKSDLMEGCWISALKGLLDCRLWPFVWRAAFRQITAARHYTPM